MNASEQAFKLMPVEDDVIVKLPVGTQIMSGGLWQFDASDSQLYNSAKEIVDRLAEPIYSSLEPKQLYEEGIKAEMLEPGRSWVTGKIRLRVVFEFIPDELENNKIPGELASPLDDIRSKNL
jgi:hypothetical protein